MSKKQLKFKPQRFDWGKLSDAMQAVTELKSVKANVRFVISEHDYSSGYWIESNEKPFKDKDSLYNSVFTETGQLKKYCQKLRYN